MRFTTVYDKKRWRTICTYTFMSKDIHVLIEIVQGDKKFWDGIQEYHNVFQNGLSHSASRVILLLCILFYNTEL